MKAISMLLLSLVVLLSGCAAQTTDNLKEQTPLAQTDHAISAKDQEEVPQVSETAKAAETVTEAEVIASDEDNTGEENSMRLVIGETVVPVTWEKNASVDALQALCPLTINMSMYGGFEQVGSIGQSIIRNDKQTSTSYGDIVLYSGDQIVIFYGTNSWAYTRLGHVELSQQEMSDLLSNGDVVIALE